MKSGFTSAVKPGNKNKIQAKALNNIKPIKAKPTLSDAYWCTNLMKETTIKVEIKKNKLMPQIE